MEVTEDTGNIKKFIVNNLLPRLLKITFKLTVFIYRTQIQKQLEYIRLVFSSLTYNHHLETTPGYRSDVMMEPIFYFVDNYAHLLGPVNWSILEIINP